MDKPNQAVVLTADEELVNMEQVSQQKHTCRSHIHIIFYAYLTQKYSFYS